MGGLLTTDPVALGLSINGGVVINRMRIIVAIKLIVPAGPQAALSGEEVGLGMQDHFIVTIA